MAEAADRDALTPAARPRIALAVLAAAAFAAALSGCGQPSGIADGRYQHSGMHFSLPVPQGWAVKELSGSLIVELQGPQTAEGSDARPTVHVYSRREPGRIDLTASARRLVRQLAPEWEPAEGDLVEAEAEQAAEEAADLELPPAEVAMTETEWAGGPAVRVARSTRGGAAAIEQELLVTARGGQVWALMVAVPEAVAEDSAQAVDQIKRGFAVW